jgi:hypothetical protein
MFLCFMFLYFFIFSLFLSIILCFLFCFYVLFSFYNVLTKHLLFFGKNRKNLNSWRPRVKEKLRDTITCLSFLSMQFNFLLCFYVLCVNTSLFSLFFSIILHFSLLFLCFCSSLFSFCRTFPCNSLCFYISFDVSMFLCFFLYVYESMQLPLFLCFCTCLFSFYNVLTKH